jgi:hypothetical protein
VDASGRQRVSALASALTIHTDRATVKYGWL